MPISNQKVAVYLELKNSKENRLGIPLPKGKVRVYKADRSGSQQLIGEDWIDHTPKDERVKIKLGERLRRRGRARAEGLAEDREQPLRGRVGDLPAQPQAEEQTVTVIEPVPGDWQVLQSSHPYEKVEAHTLRYRVAVPKDGAAKLTYRVRVRF